MLIAALFAGAFNLLAGQAGLLSFGHAAYFGIGAIATLQAMSLAEAHIANIPTPLLPIAGLVCGLLVATVAGTFATKRSGAYFALVTLAIAELIHVIAPLWESLFGGEAGLTAMRMPWQSIRFATPLEVYYLVGIWCFLGVVFLWFIYCSTFGSLVRAVRSNEQRLAFVGVNTQYIKVVAFGISGGISGLAGGLLAVASETANYTLFSPAISIQVAFFAFIGGTTFFFAPIMIAAILTGVPFLISDYTRAWPLYQGLLFMSVMLYAPNGLFSVLDNLRYNIRAKRRMPIPTIIITTVGVLLVTAGVVVAVETVSRGHIPGQTLHRSTAIQAISPIRIPEQMTGFLVATILSAAGMFLSMWSSKMMTARVDVPSRPGVAR